MFSQPVVEHTHTHTHIKTRSPIDALWKRWQSSSFSSTHFKPQPASLSALKSQLSWCLEVGTKWMKFICLESFVWVSHTVFHMQTVWVCVCLCGCWGTLYPSPYILYVYFVCTHISARYRVYNKPHNQFIITLQWMNAQCKGKTFDGKAHLKYKVFTKELRRHVTLP